jgi:hypothetical protein
VGTTLGSERQSVYIPLDESRVLLLSIVVSIPACHAGDRGSIPRLRVFFGWLQLPQRQNFIGSISLKRKFYWLLKRIGPPAAHLCSHSRTSIDIDKRTYGITPFCLLRGRSWIEHLFSLHVGGRIHGLRYRLFLLY